MSLKRNVSVILGTALLGLTVATAAPAWTFPVTGGGGQTHIGNGLMLPIQAAATAATTGTMFPALKIPVAAGSPTVMGTLAKPIKTAGAKSGYQRRLTVPPGVLKKAAAQTTVGVKFSNPTLWAVGTNLNYTWPQAQATFSTGVASLNTVAGNGGTMTYSNTLGSRFGGPGFFAVSGGAPAGILAGGAGAPPNHPTASAPVTLYLYGGVATSLGLPTTTLAPIIAVGAATRLGQGGSSMTTVTDPAISVGTMPGSNAMFSVGMTPSGTILAFTSFIGAATIPVKNVAMSLPGPWTTGQVIIAQPVAKGGAETFTLSGVDSRTAAGGGTISLVSGSLSTRFLTGPNANRGWVRLTLQGLNPADTPTMSPLALAAAAGLLLLAAGYAMRRYSANAA